MDPLIAEDLTLLLLDDEKGTFRASSYLATVLGGAVLIELALTEAATVEEKTSMWRSAKVHAESGPPPADPVLAEALRTVAEKDRSADDLVDRLGKGLKETLTDRLVERGILDRQQDKVLGLFPRTRWPMTDATHEQEVRRQVTAALVQGTEPDPRTAALVALLAAVDQAHQVIDHEGVSSREVKRRAKQIADGAWAATGVRDAITASMVAVTAAVSVATTAAVISG